MSHNALYLLKYASLSSNSNRLTDATIPHFLKTDFPIHLNYRRVYAIDPNADCEKYRAVLSLMASF